MDYDFPETVGNGIFIPTDELHHFSEGWRKTTNQKWHDNMTGPYISI
jgi:hypothetical protein